MVLAEPGRVYSAPDFVENLFEGGTLIDSTLVPKDLLAVADRVNHRPFFWETFWFRYSDGVYAMCHASGSGNKCLSPIVQTFKKTNEGAWGLTHESYPECTAGVPNQPLHPDALTRAGERRR